MADRCEPSVQIRVDPDTHRRARFAAFLSRIEAKTIREIASDALDAWLDHHDIPDPTEPEPDPDTTGSHAAPDGPEVGKEAAMMDLMGYDTGEWIRAATLEEWRASVEASRRDGGAGVIDVDGCPCYVEGNPAAPNRPPPPDEAFRVEFDTAYDQLSAELRTRFVPVVRLRGAIPDWTRETFNRQLVALCRAHWYQLSGQEYASRLSPAERAAALQWGGRAYYFVSRV